MSTYSGEWTSANVALYQIEGRAMAVITIDGRSYVDVADTISEAVSGAMSMAYPDKKIRMESSAMMGMPRIEELPEAPAWETD